MNPTQDGRTSSHGEPACLMEDNGDAPVPPSWPDTWITSALALATPAATVPIPTSDTWQARQAWRDGGDGLKG